MKSITHLLLICILLPQLLYAYPPENAAVLYYKHMEYFAKPDEALWDEIRNLGTSDQPASEEVKAWFEKQNNRHLIEELQTASELKHCDWGLDLTQGFEMLMPGLSQMRNFMYIILADAAIDASNGDVHSALDKNLAVRRMGQHVSNETLIGFLVSLAISRKCDDALTHLLGTYPIDEKTLIRLKNELLQPPYQPKSIRQPLMEEKEVCLLEISRMTPERYKKVTLDWCDDDKQDEVNKRLMELLEKNDPTFLDRSAAYLEKCYNRLFILMDKPYSQAYSEVGNTIDQAVKDSESGQDDAVLTATFCPALAKCYNHWIFWKTNYDAMLTALDIYLEKAKTGSLPETLPDSTYLDHFSGKPFIYEITTDGFILKCQQEDKVKKITHEFKFKVIQ